MLNGRRVGTLTLGIVLIVFGILFVARIIQPAINYDFILNCWPLILILLGAEILVSYILNKEDKIKYDGWAIALIVLLSFFALGMAGAEFIIDHSVEFRI